jgi:hypothetical protein
MVSNDAGSYTLFKAEAAAGGGRTRAPAQPLAVGSKSTVSACEIHSLKIQKSLKCLYTARGETPAEARLALRCRLALQNTWRSRALLGSCGHKI